jgi:hypothetical protein
MTAVERKINAFGDRTQSDYLMWGGKCTCFGTWEVVVHICAVFKALTLHLRKTECVPSNENEKWSIKYFKSLNTI